MVWAARYLRFGGMDQASVGTGALAQNLRFPGQWFQAGEPDRKSLRWSDFPANGLHQNRMRDYDPTTGRYLQADPLGLVDGASVYGYVSLESRTKCNTPRPAWYRLVDETEGMLPWDVTAI